jgi:hypothetical protein
MRRVVALILLAGLGSGCGEIADTAWRAPAPHIVVLRPHGGDPLPAQGLLVPRGRNLVLLGLDGRPDARLVGARPWWTSADTARNIAFKELAQILPDRTFVIGPARKWYLFEPPGRFRALTTPRVRLGGGISITAHVRTTDEDAFDVNVTVERAGHRLVPASADLQSIAGNLAVADSSAVDLVTGHRWKTSSGCYPAAIEKRELLMFCTPSPSDLKGDGHFVAVSPGGARRTIGHFPGSLFPHGASVSPNGKSLFGVFSPGCGPPYSFVLPTAGGVARPVSGEKNWSFASPNSVALGWTDDNRIVALIQPSGSCEGTPKSGVYLIDPATLARTYVAPTAWALWNPARR